MTAQNTLLPVDQVPAIRVKAMPADTNELGDVFGGWMMAHVDVAGSIAAQRFTKCRVVTVAIDEFVFLKPVYVGDLVSIYSEVNKVGTTSIRIKVTAYAERVRNTFECDRVVDATLTYVAIDKQRQPIAIKQQ